MSAGCGPGCGWCGACTVSWEGPSEVVVACRACERDFYVEQDEEPSYICDRCREREHARQQREADERIA